MNTPTINVHSPNIPHQNARIELNRDGLAALKAAIEMAEVPLNIDPVYRVL